MARSGVLASFSLIWTITAGATLIQIANGLLQILLPLRMEAGAIPISGIGWVASAYGLGFAAGCVAAPALVRHVGHIRAFASMAAIACVVVLAFTRAEALWEWILLRILSGLALAGLFTIIDGWVSARATKGNRGRVVSLYMICTKIALMLSPLAIGLGSIEQDGLFMLVAALMCLSLLPVSATVSEEPRAPRSVRIIVPQLFRVAPSAIVGAFAVGLMNGAVIAITPVYGVRIGLAPERAALLVLAVQAGSLIVQWPMGWLSDMTDRRRVIAGLAAGTALACVAIVWAGARSDPVTLTLAFGFWGGMALCIYAVCVAHACDLVEPDEIVPAISSLLVCWAIGSMIGPAPATFLMEAVGPQGLFYYCAAIALALFVFVAARILSRERPKSAGGFVNLPATSAAMSSLSPRAGELEENGDDREGGDDAAGGGAPGSPEKPG
ncbi:MAG: MFS transporter [Microvirga sp.]|nr:MFS transporter [Microvirga sp.]